LLANEVSEEPKSQDEEIKSYIEHHLQDDHYFSLFTDKEAGKTFGFPLPVILIDGGIKVFMSSAFDFGKQVVEKDGQF